MKKIGVIARRLAATFAPARPDDDLAMSIRTIRNAQMREREMADTIRVLNDALADIQSADRQRRVLEIERAAELDEAMYMGGAGPWRMPHAARVHEAKAKAEKQDTELTEADVSVMLEEAPGFAVQGAYGDAELMLANVQWKRETNLSWLEFTRWGIQQIILIARLRCIKDPMLRRGTNVSAQYTFGRGVQITSPDKATNELLREWRERNKKVLGQVALTDLERAKFSDGNLFFCCFTDAADSGAVNIRMIDATEILDVMTDPDDSAQPWYYKRTWTQANPNSITGVMSNTSRVAWYPALNFEPQKGDRGYFEAIEGVTVQWNSPIYHRKCGAPMKWHFGLPEVYPAIGWGDQVKRFLQDCMTIRNALAQFAMILTTKGGQQALQGAKAQLSTSVGPNASLWDQNPPTVAGGIFASGPGSSIEAFSTKGAGGDPGDVRQIKLMVCMTFGLPETFFADMNTSNLATATSLDRPTELNFMERQEVWVEDLTLLSMYQVRIAKGAVNSGFRERLKETRGIGDADIKGIRIAESMRVKSDAGVWRYAPLESAGLRPDDITVHVDFPAIIEADVPARIGAIVQAMTLGSKMGEVNGIDEKAGVMALAKELGLPDVEDLIAEMYPKSYDPDRTKEPEPQPLNVPGVPPARDPAAQMKEARVSILNAFARLNSAFRLWEARSTEEPNALAPVQK